MPGSCIVIFNDVLDNIAKNGDALAMTYPGGKNGSGVYQTIINLIPPHDTYIEPFLGAGAILRQKKPARHTIGLDLDPAVIADWNDTVRDPIVGNGDAGFRFVVADALDYLKSYPFTGSELVYCDPPYVHSTRGRKDLYRFEMDDKQHTELLDIIKVLPCMVMISGYQSALYAEAMNDWNVTTFEAMTRAGKTATEYLWFNFPEPVALHDYGYLGGNFRERERIKRKKQRWIARLKTMPILEQRALLSAIDEAWPLQASPETAIPAGSYRQK